MSNLVQKVSWNLPNSEPMQMYVYGEADVQANQQMQEPLEKLYRYENNCEDAKQLYVARTEDGYVLVVKANSADEAENLANYWFLNNVKSLNNHNINWIVDLCDNDNIIE